MIDENDFIRKIYDSADKRRIQKWYMRYCDDCRCKLSYLPRKKTQFCQSCATVRKFARLAKMELDEYLALSKTRELNDKLANRLRNRINQAIKSNYKYGSAVDNLGCSIDEFRLYLESKFIDGMSWDNRGQFGWHIDHIIPLNKFDLTNADEFKKACHYTNLQPLWWQVNLSKGKK